MTSEQQQQQQKYVHMHMGAVHSNKMMQNATIYLFDYIAWQPARNENMSNDIRK